MRLDKTDLNLFIVLDALYAERSVTQAAAVLNLTQPAVSNALNRLRQTFEDPLFVRTPQGMVPTPLTETIIGDVRKALQLLGRSVATAMRFEPGSADKHFRIGMSDLAQALLLPPLMVALAEVAPGVSVHCYYKDRATATEELKNGRLDLLLDAPMVNAREFETRPLGFLPYVVAMGPEHPLARKPLTVEDYLAAGHIHVSSRTRGRGQMDIALQTLGQKRQVKARVQSYLVAAHIAASSDLLWTAPALLVATTALATSPLPFAVEPLAFSLYWVKSADDDPALQWFKSLVEDVVNRVL